MTFAAAVMLLQAAVVWQVVPGDATVGDTVVVEDQEVSAANRYPVFPDDFLYQSGALNGDRIVLKLRNSTAGAIVTQSAAAISAVA